MDITKRKLQQAASKNIISTDQVDELYHFLLTQSNNEPKFSFTHILYYFGGLIAIAAMSLFMGLSWESFGGAGIFFISLTYAIVGLKLTQNFSIKNLTIPAGICATFVVCLTPIAIYGLFQWFNFWPENETYTNYHKTIRWHWVYLELGTVLAGFIMAKKYKYPFLIMPIAATLWYMIMDLTAMFYGADFTWDMRKLVSLYTGLAMITAAFYLDIKLHKKADYAFWLYLFGVIAFWGGLSSLDSDSELTKLGYFCINLCMIVVGAILARRVFVIFGALGSFCYLGYLASHVFKNAWLFPISLTAIGLSIIYFGIFWQKNENTLTKNLRAKLPKALQELLEAKF